MRICILWQQYDKEFLFLVFLWEKLFFWKRNYIFIFKNFHSKKSIVKCKKKGL
ncbi:hypothetical protein HMPREF0078_0010 [Anaerococcus vaginalis ATCC 51170]|uniref:Uncharacterized protein n=1 Tax=Anaerococcus vaginalis ATCC 51170 TaxID=655811 RepID=C7HRY8_9FIRM|nr:hypothetical protein HMPREF0078_0010 [Anaerococcus vaginalis ATCC 51170]